MKRLLAAFMAVICCACERNVEQQNLEPEVVPTMPELASGVEWVGASVTNTFAVREDCLGWVDAVSQRYRGANPGVELYGWGWDTSANSGYAEVVVTDSSGVIRGTGQGGGARPDVPAAVRGVNSELVGFAALTSTTSGAIEVYGINRENMTACRLGGLDVS